MPPTAASRPGPIRDSPRAARPFVLFLNPDAIVEADALPRALAYLESMPSVGVVGCRTLNADGTPQPTVDRFHSVRRLVAEALGERPRPVVRGLAPAASGPVDWVYGSFLLGRRAALAEVGRLRRGVRDVRRGSRPLSSLARRRLADGLLRRGDGGAPRQPQRRACATARSATWRCCAGRCAFSGGAAAASPSSGSGSPRARASPERRRRRASRHGRGDPDGCRPRPALCRHGAALSQRRSGGPARRSGAVAGAARSWDRGGVTEAGPWTRQRPRRGSAGDVDRHPDLELAGVARRLVSRRCRPRPRRSRPRVIVVDNGSRRRHRRAPRRPAPTSSPSPTRRTAASRPGATRV